MDTMKATKMQPAKDAVIEELRMLAEDLHVNVYNRYSSAMSKAADEIEWLRARIEVMEKQKPVAFALYSGWAFKAAYHKEHEACDQRDRRQLSADLGGSLEAYRVVPLYALPGAVPSEHDMPSPASRDRR